MGKRRFKHIHIAKQGLFSYLVSLLSPKSPSWVLVPTMENKSDSLNRIFPFKLAPDRLKLPEYRSGQYVFLSFPGHSGLYNPRAFYIASSPYNSRYLEFFGKDTDEWTLQAKRLSEEAGTGSRMLRARLHGPFGNFSMPKTKRRGAKTPESHVFLAAGMGAVPFFSMLHSLSYDKPDLHILFLWGARKRDELFALNELGEIAVKMKGLSFIPVLSHDPLWTGEKGHIDAEKLSRLVGAEWDGASCWVSGPPQFRSAIQKILLY
ncbi:hypothetical protein MASR2M78_25350 [Treponema sp.]